MCRSHNIVVLTIMLLILLHVQTWLSVLATLVCGGLFQHPYTILAIKSEVKRLIGTLPAVREVVDAEYFDIDLADELIVEHDASEFIANDTCDTFEFHQEKDFASMNPVESTMTSHSTSF